METKDIILLCRPCAEQFTAEKKITIGGSLRDKNTCANCGRRRFVYRCTKISTKPPVTNK